MKKSDAKRTILIVDDDPMIRKPLRCEFEFDNFHVVEAGDGKEALEVLTSLKIDVILTDVHMPIMDGFELAARVNLMSEPPRLYFMSGVIQENHLMQLGARRAFAKPFDFNDLVETILEG